MNDPAGHPYDRLGLIRLTDRYLAALIANDPSAVPLADGVRTAENLQQVKPGEGLWATATFAADCERHENGLVTAGPNRGAPPPGSTFPAVPIACAAQIDSKAFTYIADIDNRRVFAADPVTGLAMGLSMFRHPMDNVPYEITLADGTTTMHAPAFAPFDLPAAHIFKIGPDRQIHEIEAMGFVAPYASPTGW